MNWKFWKKKTVYPRVCKMGWFGPEIKISEIKYRVLDRNLAGFPVWLKLERDFWVTLPFRVPNVKITPFISFSNGRLWIQEGYEWDGASGPTLDTKSAILPSVVHDALYCILKESKRKYFDREAADKFFYWLLRNEGMMWLRAKIWYRCVRIHGGSYIGEE